MQFLLQLCEHTLHIYRVGIDLVIKVGDFGLSRDIYIENYYRMAKTNKCPVKWMPPEMIRDGISTEKSDIVSLCSLFQTLYIVQLPSSYKMTYMYTVHVGQNDEGIFD